VVGRLLVGELALIKPGEKWSVAVVRDRASELWEQYQSSTGAAPASAWPSTSTSWASYALSWLAMSASSGEAGAWGRANFWTWPSESEALTVGGL
jgi:hypothetical protein